MKKIVIIILIVFGSIANAQKSKKDEGIVFGLKGGLNISNFIGDIQDNSIRTSVHLGIFSEIIINDKFSIQPEILYSGQGYSGSATPGFSRSKYDYLNLPVLAKIYVADKISIEAGPQIGFLLSAKERTSNDNATIPKQKTVDLGLNLGLAYDLKNGMFFQTRYNLGLSNINSSDNANAVKYTNSVIQLSVGVRF
jgi:hypothetical protein